MKDLAQHTRLSPQARVQNLLEFRQSLDRNEEAASQLSRWNMKFDEKLVDIPARVLSTQNILQGMMVIFICTFFLGKFLKTSLKVASELLFYCESFSFLFLHILAFICANLRKNLNG